MYLIDSLIYFGFGIAGVVLHILLKRRDAKKTRLSDVDWGQHISYSLRAVVLIIIVIFARDEIASWFPVTKFSMVLVGAMADSMIKNMFSKFNGIKK